MPDTKHALPLVDRINLSARAIALRAEADAIQTLLGGHLEDPTPPPPPPPPPPASATPTP